MTKLEFPENLMGPSEVTNPGAVRFSSAEKIGELLKFTLQNDPDFYLFSPDETTSNKLSAAYDVTTRAWNLPKETWDLPESASGRIIELLSENTLMAVMVGHILGGGKGSTTQAGHSESQTHATGGYGAQGGGQAMMTSYEAFFEIVASQIIQHLKFLQQSESVAWRDSVPALNLLSTSTCWRQDHNGFSHQSPALISTLLSHPGSHANCLFPVDDVAAAAAYKFMYNSQNVVNLTTFNKTEEPRFIDKNHAAFQLEYGASIFGFVSDDNPDYVFTAAGDIVTKEALAAIKILRQDLPHLKFRFVGVAALTHGAIGTTYARMPQALFDDYFTQDKPIIANFHGYPDDFRAILTNYAAAHRISAHGFIEQGSTTTPFEMLALNHASRFDLCMDVAAREGREDLVSKYREEIAANAFYATKYGEDLDSML